ncbi:hypothetical protein DBR45_33980, partial [Pseudomonas sp. HMWF031]
GRPATTRDKPKGAKGCVSDVDSQDDRYEMKGSIMPALSGRMKSQRRLTTKSDPGPKVTSVQACIARGHSIRKQHHENA